MNRHAPSVIDRILALGEKASRYSEAELARNVGASRERIRQLKAQLPHKPTSRRTGVPGYGCKVEHQFYTAMRGGIDMLVALVDVRRDDECWPWLGHKLGGYGFYGHGNRYVHRQVYVREHGPIPKGMVVVHKLAGPPCCNPRHLQLATRRYTAWRDLRDGTRTRVSAELRTLTPAEVRAIRRAYARLPRVKVDRRGQKYEQVPHGSVKALVKRFGMKDGKLLVHVATGKSGCWLLPGKPRFTSRVAGVSSGQQRTPMPPSNHFSADSVSLNSEDTSPIDYEVRQGHRTTPQFRPPIIRF